MMSRGEIAESVLIIVVLLSLWPFATGYRALWYDVWLLTAVALMVWVAVRRFARIRHAAREAQRKRDEAERSGRPPWITP